MLTFHTEGYNGKQSESNFSANFTIGSLYGVITFEEGTSEEQGAKLFESFKMGLKNAKINNLSTFEDAVSKLILTLNLPAHVGLSIGVLIEGILYIKTVGNGQVYFRRKNNFDLLLSGDKTASGFINELDLVIFTTSKIQDLIGKNEDIQTFVEVLKPSDILQKLHDQGYAQEDQGFSALFVEFGEFENNNDAIVVYDDADKPQQINLQSSPISDIDKEEKDNQNPFEQSFHDRSSGIIRFIRTKRFAVSSAIIIFLLLIWSVAFGYQRRESAKVQKEIDLINNEIEKKLNEAQSESISDVKNAISLVAEAKSEFSKLKLVVGDKKESELKKIESNIAVVEEKVLKRESKEYEEFYDLTLENKDAKGTKIAMQEEYVAILDTKEKTIFVLNLKEKSLKKYINNKIAQAASIGIHNNDIFFATVDKGLYKFTSQSKINEIVKKDSELDDIVDIELYNGNIYLLDAGNSSVYKYLITEGGYSDKREYFGTGQTIQLRNATGMTIDGSIYISTTSSINKFLSGARESFKTDLPTDSPEFSDIYTDRDIEQVYVLDRKNSAVYILSKEGKYQRQIQSDIFSNTSSIFVFENNIYALRESKIYNISLD